MFINPSCDTQGFFSYHLLTDLTLLTPKILLQQKFWKKKICLSKNILKIKKSGKHVSDVSDVTDMSRVELRANLCNLVTLYWITFIYYICKNAARIVISQRRIFAKIIDMQVIV